MTRVPFALGLVLWALYASPVHAGSYGTELPFAAGVGGRASGMGLAGASVTGTPSLHVVNPALLAGAEYNRFEFYRTTFFDSDAQFLAVSYVHPGLDWGSVGISVLRVGVSGIEERDAFNTLLSSDLSDNMTRAVVGYALDVAPSLKAGVNVKLDRHTFGDVSGTGVGADAGVLFDRELRAGMLRHLRAGLGIENLIEPSVKLDQEDVPDPMRVTLGASAEVYYGTFGFTTALDFVSPRYSPMRVRMGQEVTYGTYFALRAGFDGATPTFGLGGQYRSIALDYAFRSEDLGSNHRISLSVAFGASREDRLRDRERRLADELQRRVDRTVDELEARQMRALVTRADSLFAAGRYDEAKDQYDMVLLWSPGDEHAARRMDRCERNQRVARAETLMADGDYLDALYHLNQARQAAPGDARIDELAVLCQDVIDEAEDRSRMVERLLSTSIDVYARGEYGDALAGFEEILRVDPDNSIARQYRNKSEANIEQAVERHLRRSRELARSGRYDAAVDAMQRALSLRPDSDLLRSELAGIAAERDRAARETTRARGATAPTSDSVANERRAVDTDALDRDFERGVELLERGRFADASEALRRVWTVAPSHRGVVEPLTKAYLFMGMRLYSEGRYTDAIAMWERILTIDPDNVKARRYLEKSREEAERLVGASQ